MIRKAEITDCMNLAALSLQVWLHTYATQGLCSQISSYVLSNFTENHFVNLINNHAVDIRVFEKDSHLIGFIVVDLESKFEASVDTGFEVATLYVSEHFHGIGVGRQLIQEVKRLHGVPFWLSTWTENHDALGFYDKLGFEIVGELHFSLDGELHQNHVLAYNGT
ncbi:GNAT family N-acetyltransferase [Vibrio parahaemolyticus]|nr:GNAT family N-acetyltransferase [Vibrio parahaemolyticus]HCH6293824.1 GNAT family N-acetyltransferase [Vibrio parahaemolyticus]